MVSSRGAWLAPLVGHAALDLGVVSSSSILDEEITLKKIFLTFIFETERDRA